MCSGPVYNAVYGPGLEWLDIHSNGVDSLGNYYALRDDYALKYVDARKNKITGLEVLSVLPSIEEMHLQDNMIRFGHQQPLYFLFLLASARKAS